MQCDTQGHVAELRESTHRAQVAPCGTDAWQGPRESTRMPGWHHVVGGLANEGPTGYWALDIGLGR